MATDMAVQVRWHNYQCGYHWRKRYGSMHDYPYCYQYGYQQLAAQWSTWLSIQLYCTRDYHAWLSDQLPKTPCFVPWWENHMNHLPRLCHGRQHSCWESWTSRFRHHHGPIPMSRHSSTFGPTHRLSCPVRLHVYTQHKCSSILVNTT